MSGDSLTSVQGVHSAWRRVERIAHRIAAGSVNAQRAGTPGAGDQNAVGRTGPQPAKDTVKIDLFEEMAALDKAAIDVKANLRALRTELELEEDTLDILA